MKAGHGMRKIYSVLNVHVNVSITADVKPDVQSLHVYIKQTTLVY